MSTTLREHLDERLADLRASGRVIGASEVWDGSGIPGLPPREYLAEILEYVPPDGLVEHSRTGRQKEWEVEVLSPDLVLERCRIDISRRREHGSGYLCDYVLRELLRSSLVSSLDGLPLLIHFAAIGPPQSIAQELDWLEASAVWGLLQDLTTEQWAEGMGTEDAKVRALVQRLYTRVQQTQGPPEVAKRAR